MDFMGGADICFMKAIKVFPDGNRQLPNDEIDARQLKESNKSAIKYLSKLSKYYGSSWSKIYKHTFIKENNIRFPNDRRVSEDLGFVLQCILNAQSYDALEIDYYYYRKAVESSITSKVTYKSFCGLKTFVEESSEKLTNNKKPNGIIEKYAMSFVAYEFSIMIWQYAHLDKENKKEALEFLKKYDWVFSYSNNKTRIVKVLYKCLGVVLSANVLEFYMKHRYKIALFCKKIEKDN